MNTLSLISHVGPLNENEDKVISQGLLSHHKNRGHERKSEVFSVFLKDQKENIVGGIKVTYLWNGMEINSLWVDESLRKLGWGKKLVQFVEQEAIRRGCTVSYVNTFTWQAPEFYKKIGYSSYGVLEDFPPGNALYYFSRSLGGIV